MRQRAGSVIPMVRNLGLFFAVIVTVVFVMIAGQFPTKEDPLIPALSSKYYSDLSRVLTNGLSNNIGNETLKNILKTELPVLSLAERNENGGKLVKTNPPFLRAGLNLLAGVRLEDPLTYLKAQIHMMEVVPVTADNFAENEIDEVTEPPGSGSPQEPEIQPFNVTNTIASDVPLIGVYSTHTSETYELTDGLTHLKGKAGGVTAAARAFKEIIEEQYGIGVTYDATIHDLAFNQSYLESEKTVRRLIEENPGLRMIFDIHRDGNIPREQSVVNIKGQNAAKILIVVGTDARSEHPRWEKNLTLARLIAAKLDSLYPGLSRGITIKDGRFNQQYSTGALLVEVGSTQNTTEEAEVGSRLFANAVVAVLNDLQEPGEMVRSENN